MPVTAHMRSRWRCGAESSCFRCPSCESPIQGIGATALLRKDRIMTPIKFGRLSRYAWTCALVCLTLASCSEGPLDPHGPVGKAERLILLDATAIMLAEGGPVILLTFWFAWWVRSSYRPAPD